MYFFIYDAVPIKGNSAREKYGGAQVACWINVKNIKTARQKAVAMIQGYDWKIRKRIEEHFLTREKAEQSTGLQYYEQALTDTEVLVFYTYPKKKKTLKKL
jgi:hypothetical protein